VIERHSTPKKKTKLLHCRTDVFAAARVYVHFSWWGWQALNRCLEHKCMCSFVRYTNVFDLSLHIWKHALRRTCTCAHVCAVCSLAMGDEGGGVQLVYAGHLLLAWHVIISMRKDKGFGSVHGCTCVYTPCTLVWYSDVGPGVGTKHLGGPEESRWTKSRYVCVRISVFIIFDNGIHWNALIIFNSVNETPMIAQ